MAKGKAVIGSPDAAAPICAANPNQGERAKLRICDALSPDTPATAPSTLLPSKAQVLLSILAGKQNGGIPDRPGIDEIAVKEHIKSILRRVRRAKNQNPTKPKDERG
ncbi:hypothetical protein [Microvirga sp. VF16]|uniref:hypothetical protein n=1 Tax=Microvirga sp. VF16 TaxID=2807101 RepID=UPI00193D0C8F|nr:hypothetical protein [Microvirga sp. VF16]QRM32482.1 hypothetical protein JO965_30790 [Microvirga sp. VF16]